jgi:hypothetical protein
MRTPAKTVEQKLSEGLAKAVEVGECLEWQGAFSNHYTQPCVKHRKPGSKSASNLSVPQLIWEAKNGPKPPGSVIFRTCTNNACIHDDHIACGTRADWQKARKKAGATKHSLATKIKITTKARSRPTTLNTLDKARQIRLLAAEGVGIEESARITGVSESMALEIRCGRAWRDTSSHFAGLGARP